MNGNQMKNPFKPGAGRMPPHIVGLSSFIDYVLQHHQ